MHPELHDSYMEGESERGVVLWTRARGRLPSSTRAEAHAILLAIHAATPLHIATDSGACVKRLRAILRGLPPPRPWPLVRDGDLWAAIAKAVHRRGPRCPGL
eukprot:14830946-Alexandrium_andersonii.AAC.1